MTRASLPTSLVSASSLVSQRTGSGAFAGPLAGLCLRAALESVRRVRVGSLGEVWVESGFGKGGCSLWVIFQGTLETCPPPHQLWLAYHLPVSGSSSEWLLRFQPGVCDSGNVGDPGGRWVAPLLVGLWAPHLPWVISGLRQAGKVRSCVISSTSLRR